ncbi:ATP synthase F1, gamma subunit [Gordonia bronchialis DSM 43247]|uniref:ATP synthase gamma chain n=1 Tax=Gordonia bronchialis (strain ATCC 25592 / DSM 43247 / BCRC 13721 / JCM 3198 / KCTC 3076 / NBRC 16047 / NCTC 10667) TaxID=526226 RepID=D0L9I6_GORB4|nr:F0F1 ATP synthase subunit gamma [Gordonia bronchialis]ACY21174.1 ATP synthase F1, gamma subunit [Gordonia bronchialis DSM 43247]MCC3323957.1 F0F1 ATP synthase subunit gamma [Gordonia bronchialis]QGS25135.1 F0F1 ATP synthase subunit gamma [Gordonia bronchialis]UAK38589.1 F0F1 ATP synthase subunit gamma [Gordonia bronchialis]STQ64045.1 F-ATPase gamma subunit [Gordonia bronchialis]
MASIRELRSRIRSVQSTKKITKAQELIATSRITKAQARVAAAKPYAHEMTEVLSELASNSGSLDHPLLVEREKPKRAGVLVVTSDRGMCGGYNANVLRSARELIALLREEGKEPVIFVMGTKGVGFFSFRGTEVAGSWTGFSQAPEYSDAAQATNFLVDLFLAGSREQVDRPDGDGSLEGIDELHLVYTRFVSMLTQSPEVRRIAPLVVSEYDDESEAEIDSSSRNYSFEPGAETLLDALLPKYVATRVYAALLDSSASESAARRTAMKAATDNAEELSTSLSREANQLRQAQITQEISEIVGGSSALAN